MRYDWNDTLQGQGVVAGRVRLIEELVLFTSMYAVQVFLDKNSGVIFVYPEKYLKQRNLPKVMFDDRSMKEMC